MGRILLRVELCPARIRYLNSIVQRGNIYQLSSIYRPTLSRVVKDVLVTGDQRIIVSVFPGKCREAKYRRHVGFSYVGLLM